MPDQLAFWQWVFPLITAALLIDRSMCIVTLFHYFIEFPFSGIIVQVLHVKHQQLLDMKGL